MDIAINICHDVCVGAKTLDRNELKLATIVVTDSLSKSIDLGFKRSSVTVRVKVRVRVMVVFACGSKIYRIMMCVAEYNFLCKIHPRLHVYNAISN